MGQGEAQDAGVERVAKTPQHTLAQYATVDIDDILHAAVDDYHSQEHAAQQQQVLNMGKLIVE